MSETCLCCLLLTIQFNNILLTSKEILFKISNNGLLCCFSLLIFNRALKRDLLCRSAWSFLRQKTPERFEYEYVWSFLPLAWLALGAWSDLHVCANIGLDLPFLINYHIFIRLSGFTEWSVYFLTWHKSIIWPSMKHVEAVRGRNNSIYNDPPKRQNNSDPWNE